MNTTELSKLADVLRKNGAEVFSGQSKFLLSLDLLIDLNNSFSLIVDQRDMMNSSFHVINSSSEKVETFRDMHFLHDFIQRTSSLKLTPPYTASKKGNISQFKNLKLLAIHNLGLDAIVGIDAIRQHLQQLICTRCVCDMKHVLVSCGGDNCELDQVGHKWDDLKEAVFSHNNLEMIDCLSLTPNLHTLDLSHNNIEDADALNALLNLKNLNLSFNKLVKMPAFTGTLCNRIQILILCYNFIEDITTISNLTNLRELDLSGNCIVEHKALVPVANLATLQLLNLTENPVSYHPQHRSRTASYLNDNTSSVRFLLDGKLLSKSEKALTGSLHPRMRIRTTSSNSSSQIPVEKPRRVRNVVIPDNEYTPIMENDDQSFAAASFGVSGEHLDAKRQIEHLKQQYGEHWLKDHAGSLVQDVLGIERSSVLSSTPYNSLIEFGTQEIAEDALDNQDDNTTQPYITASETINQDIIAEPVTLTFSEKQDEVGLYETETLQRSCTPSSDEDDGLGDGEENIFLATIQNTDESVFIVITQTHILERESTKSKELSRWPIETLTTCESDEKSITVHFDTLKMDAKSRTYDWDDEESPNLLAALRNLINNQPPPQANLNIYRCLKCSTQFGVELAKTLFNDDVENKCPTCGSDLVFEDDS